MAMFAIVVVDLVLQLDHDALVFIYVYIRFNDSGDG